MDFDLGKKIGPLPMGVWIAVIVGGLGIGYFINKNMSGGGSAETPIDPDSDVGTGGLVPVPWEPEDTQPTTPQDNVAWGNQVVSFLIATGVSPTEADQAVRKYLSAMPLTAKENAMIALALARLGPPPEPIAPVDQPPQQPDDITNTPKPKPPITIIKPPATPGWSNDVPFAIRAAFPATLVKSALARTGHSNTGTHINLSDLKRGLNNIGHRYGTTVNVTDVAVLVTWNPPKQPGIRLTKAPSTARAGMPFAVYGQTTLNGKNAYVTPISIQRYVNGKWQAHAVDGGGPGGKWSTTLIAGRKGETRRYRFVVTDGKGPKAKTASTTLNVRFT